MKKKLVSKAISVFLSFLMFQSTSSFLYVFAESNEKDNSNFTVENEKETDKKESLGLNNIPKKLYSTLKEEMYNSIDLDENVYFDLYSIGTENIDGSKSLFTFNYPIKYYDKESGCINFIDNTISKEMIDDEVKYVSHGNSYNVIFSENISDGLSFSNDQYSIEVKLTENANENTVEIIDNELIYDNVIDESTSICYSLENTGIKESIIVDTPNNRNTYDFLFSSDNLTPKENKGQKITLVDKTTGESVFEIQPAYIVDSYSGEYVEGEEHITYDNYYEVENIDDDSFVVHMILDYKFLNSDKTVYPCIIDPTIEDVTYATGNSSYVMQSGGTGYVNNQLSVGSFNGSGEHLSYVKAASVEQYRWINPESIQNASFVVKSASSGNTGSCKVNLYDSTTTSIVSAVTYSELISSLGSLQSSVIFTNLGASYSFDITYLYKQWLSYKLGIGGKNPVYGFILRSEPASSTPGRWFSSTSTSDTYFRINYFSTMEIEDGFYNIKNVYTGKYLKYNSGNQLTLSTNGASDDCKWQIILSRNDNRTIEDGTYVISPYNNLNFFVKGNSTGQAVTTNSNGSKYRIIKNQDNTFRIMPDNGSGVGISNALGINVNNINIQEYSNNNTMKWTFEPVVNRFFSEYTPEKYNNSNRQKLNCYGYVMGHILHHSISGSYKQQPGYFAALSDYNSISSLTSIDANEYMRNMKTNMELDANRLGYTITEYTPTGNTVKQLGSDSRLIAVTVSSMAPSYPYHFYMQHNDGTWSHKKGDGDVTNVVYLYNNPNPIFLNNQNIIEYAGSNNYINGLVKFFEITRDAVPFYAHSKIDSYSIYQETPGELYYSDIAGENMFNSSEISLGIQDACFDAFNDVDFFVFTPDESRNFNITTICDSNYDIDCRIYDFNGQLLASDIRIGQVNMNFNATLGKRYFIKIYNYNGSPGEYSVILS